MERKRREAECERKLKPKLTPEVGTETGDEIWRERGRYIWKKARRKEQNADFAELNNTMPNTRPTLPKKKTDEATNDRRHSSYERECEVAFGILIRTQCGDVFSVKSDRVPC